MDEMNEMVEMRWMRWAAWACRSQKNIGRVTLLTCNAALSLRVLVAQVILNVRQGGKLLLKRSGGAGSRQGNQDNLNTKCCKLQVLLNCLNQRLLKMQKVNLGKLRQRIRKKENCMSLPRWLSTAADSACSSQKKTKVLWISWHAMRHCLCDSLSHRSLSTSGRGASCSSNTGAAKENVPAQGWFAACPAHLGGCQQRLAENVSPNTRRTSNFIMQHVLLAACAPGWTWPNKGCNLATKYVVMPKFKLSIYISICLSIQLSI